MLKYMKLLEKEGVKQLCVGIYGSDIAIDFENRELYESYYDDENKPMYKKITLEKLELMLSSKNFVENILICNRVNKYELLEILDIVNEERKQLKEEIK